MAESDFAPHNLTAPFSNIACRITPSSEHASYPAWKLLDGGSGSDPFWLAYLPLPITVTIQLNQRQILSSYSLKAGGGAYDPTLARMAKNWTLEGSNDGSTWDTLDTVTNQTGWADAEVRNFVCDTATTAYDRFRLNVSANNGDAGYLVVAEMYLYANPPDAAYSDGAPHNMTTDSAPSPYVASVSSRIDGSWAAHKAFDGDFTDTGRWVGTNGSADWLCLDLGSGNGLIPKSYAIKINSGLYNYTQAPKAWTLEGSNDGSSWTTLDTRSAQTDWLASEHRLFYAGSSTAYRYIRLNISAYQTGSSYVSVGELYLWGTLAAPSGGTQQPVCMVIC